MAKHDKNNEAAKEGATESGQKNGSDGQTGATDIIQVEKKVEVISATTLNDDKYERLKRIGWLNIDLIQKAKVLVVGCGALGNEVTKNLALSGFKHIDLVDMDYIVKSNLNRCIFFSELDAKDKRLKAEVVKEQLLKVDPSIEINIYTQRIETLPEDFIPSHGVVFGCLDNIAARLHVNAHCYFQKIPYIDGATLGMLGKVQVVYPPETPCLECGMNKTHMKVLEKRFSCTGADITFYEAKMAAEITTTSVVAAIQVREALKVVNLKPDALIRNIFYYDANRNVSDILEMSINPDCPHHRQEFTKDDAKENTSATEQNVATQAEGDEED